LGQGVGDFPLVAADEGRQQDVEIGKMSSQRGGAHAQGLGEAGGGHGVDAVSGHEALGNGEDAGVLLLLTLREVGGVALEVFGVGAEDSVWGSHGGTDIVLGKFGCQGLFSQLSP